MKGTPFYKMCGSGNDFVMLDGRVTTVDDWPTARVKAICDRRRGVGADGLAILTPLAPESVRMTYWNADGSRGAMCGNAALCSGRLAVHLELVQTMELCLLTDAGPVLVRSAGMGGAAEIKLPDLELGPEFTDIPLGSGERWMTRLIVGVPHLVIRVDDIEVVEPKARGRSLRFDPAFGPEGANVNFLSRSHAPGAPWMIRTYERGVEDETLACGTGTVAAAVALASRGEAGLPLQIQSRGGLELSVRADLHGQRAVNVWLGGQGELVFRGVWDRA